MKKITWVLLLFIIPLLTLAQERTTANPNPYTNAVDSKLQLLNKNEITTDILYDRVYPMANLEDFNHTAVDTSHVNHFFNAYAELQLADYTAKWISISSLKNLITAETQNQIPIGIINVDYEIFDESAIEDNLIDVSGADSLLIDVANRPRSPYLKKTAIVASPLIKDTHSKTVTFKTGGAYTMDDAAKGISTIDVDFDNGQGYQSLPLTGTKTITYATTGLRHLKFKLTFVDNSVKYTYAKLRINASNPLFTETQLNGLTTNSNCGINTPIEFMSTLTFQGYDEGTAYSAAGAYRIYQGGNAVDRPVIVVDGFDPSEENNLNDIYDFLEYTSGNLGGNLRSAGFDIIPLNFLEYQATDGTVINGGSDYVERNAMALIELITRVNACKVGNEPIKVIGFSMGGLVARYALRYMELNNIPHEADLFVSVDTPHKGAVVPIAIQEMADLLDDILPNGLGDPLDDILLTPAAKQLLVHHYLAHSIPTAGAPNFHDRFYNDLENMGFPQQTRNIAVVNGVSSGTAINIPGEKFVDGFLETILIFPTRAKLKAKLKYTPGRSQTAEALNFRIQIRFIFANITVYRRIRDASTSSALGSYENPPGGFYDVESLTTQFFDVYDDFSFLSSDFFKDFLVHVNLELNNPNFSFVPVKSSLAYSGTNPDLYEDFSDRDLVCTGETPFDSYFTATTGNQEHIALFNDSANYIEQEILGNPQLPNTDVTSSNNLLGPDIICVNDIVTFEFASCYGAPVNSWQVSNNLQIVTSTDHSVTVESLTSTRAVGFVRAVFPNENIQKDIWLGTSTAPASLSGPESVDSGSIVAYGGGIAEGATSYTWRFPYPYEVVTQMNYAGDNWQIYEVTGRSISHVFTGYGENEGLVELRGVNSCGIGDPAVLYVVHDGCVGGGCGGIAVAPIPNTADTEFSLDFSTYPQGTFYIYIYDQYSNIIYQGQSSNIEKTIETAYTPNGIYYLHIHDGSDIAIHQLVIQH